MVNSSSLKHVMGAGKMDDGMELEVNNNETDSHDEEKDDEGIENKEDCVEMKSCYVCGYENSNPKNVLQTCL